LEDELAQKFAEMIITSSQINGVKICFVNISDEHIYKAAKDMKADLYEGYFLSEKELLG
jgi:EAL domain-containing protein (putative c-di-GMP-specific phosphodiesterase class I)